MEIVEDSYIIPSTGPLREQLAEMRREREAWEAQLAKRPAQPTLSDVMELLQQLMSEVLQLQTAGRPTH